MLGGLEAFAAGGRGRHLLLTALAAAASWFGGSPQLAHFGSLTAGLYALALAPGLWRRRPLDAVLAGAAAPAGLLLAAPAVLPALELARLGPRGSGISHEFATSWKWTDRWALALFVLPRAYHWRWGLNLWEATGYLGVLPLALAAAAPLSRRGVPLFLALGLLGVGVGVEGVGWKTGGAPEGAGPAGVYAAGGVHPKATAIHRQALVDQILRQIIVSCLPMGPPLRLW